MSTEEKSRLLSDEMDLIQAEYEKNNDNANYGLLLALTSSKLGEIEKALNDPEIIKRKKPKLIDEEYFVEHYCNEFGIKGFVGYLLSLDEESIIAFKALIDFMQADFYILSEAPRRPTGEDLDLKAHWFWPGEGVHKLEFMLMTDYQLDAFILDYQIGQIKISFNAAQLLAYLINEIAEVE